MSRHLPLLCSFCCLAACLVSAFARADELPTRKAGLWEMKINKSGTVIPEMTIQHCTDATTDKDMINAVSPLSKQVCSKQEVKKTATGYVSDSVCSVAGASITSHSDITGDFDAAYTVTSQSHIDKGVPDSVRDTTTKIDAKYIGDCKAGQKAGDIVMPGGMKFNVKDMEKLKNLLPSSKPSPSPAPAPAK
jgi:hypothetical protein